jgi:S-adenosylmethionine decarboxylase
MPRIAPEIVRQRLLVEGYFTAEVDEQRVEDFLHGLAAHLGLRTYGRPAVFAPGGEGRDENQGYDAFLPLIDSGISLYVWSGPRFVSVVLFTCKAFDEGEAIAFTKEFFGLSALEHSSF